MVSESGLVRIAGVILVVLVVGVGRMVVVVGLGMDEMGDGESNEVEDKMVWSD